MSSKGEGFQSLSGKPETAEPARQSQTGVAVNPATSTSTSRRESSPVSLGHASTSSSTSALPLLRKQPSVNLHSAVASAPLPLRQSPLASTHNNSSNNKATNNNNDTNNIISPRSSRNTSPIRSVRAGHETPRASSRPSAPTLRNRHSSQDTSPHRPTTVLHTPSGTTLPSAAAIQRAFSATSVPQLQAVTGTGTGTGTGPGLGLGNSVTEAVSKLPKMQQRAAAGSGSGESTPVWPQSPRLKSPPPSAVRSRRNSSLSQRGVTAPSILVQSSTPTSSTPPLNALTGDGSKNVEGKKDDQLQPIAATKAPSRGPSGPRPTLETVEENTPPNGQAANLPALSPSLTKPQARTSDEDKPTTASTTRSKPNGYLSDATSRLAESESEGNKSGDGKSRIPSQDVQPASRPKAMAAGRATYPSLSSAKSRQSEGTRNMTVETETVVSVPQTNIGGNLNAGERGRLDGGSLRMKPSTETIRPRKERKRTTRKAPSVSNGTASSKADIFEARVATQVDEQGSSSDETFVYESNTEPQERSRRHHSRTPSGTSLHSQSEYRPGIRNYGGVHGSGDHRVAGKRSMKFSNNAYNIMDSPTDDGNGTVRAHARHIGRLGRAAGSGSRASLYGQDSPFTQASKVRNSERQSSRPGSPKSVTSNPQQHRPSSLLFGRKTDFDLEGGEGDDERTPLNGTVRTPRSSRTNGRRFNADSMRSQSYYDGSINYQAHSINSQSSSSSRFSRLGGCLFGLIVFVLVVLGAVGFLVMSTKPLYGFEVDRIENVLASEQEIMLDLIVGAVNPNVLGVSITEMDLNIFAKSKYISPIGGGHDRDPLSTARNGRSERRRGRSMEEDMSRIADFQDPDGHWHPGLGPGDSDNKHDGEDEGTDPIEGDTQTMLLGRIFHFDSGLTFDGSPVKRHPHHSMGELRLARPGNKTEMGGSERWERVLQYPFELILRGVLKYELPISSRTQSAAIGASVFVHPEEGSDNMGRSRVHKVDRTEQWQWIELGDAEDDDVHDTTLLTVTTI